VQNSHSDSTAFDLYHIFILYASAPFFYPFRSIYRREMGRMDEEYMQRGNQRGKWDTLCFPIFNNSVRTSKRTQHFTITEITWLMFKEVIVVYSENHKRPVNTEYNITDCQNRCYMYDHHRMLHPQVAGGGDCFCIWRLADKRWPSGWGTKKSSPK
jgi:hypothetical protein